VTLRRIARNALAIIAFASVPSRGHAQEAPLKLTLDEAIARAEQNSHRVAELLAGVEAAAAAEAGRRADDMPIVAVRGWYTRTNHVKAFAVLRPILPPQVLYPDVPDNYHARLDLQWPIYTGGRSNALERAAHAEREAASFDVAAARADLRLEATRAFWALVTARQTQEVLARSLDSIDAHVAELRARLDQGLIPPNELLSAEAQQSRQRLLAIDAQNLRGIAEADLRRVIGEDDPRSIEPAAPLDPPAQTEADVAALVAAPRRVRPERAALDNRVEAARERETAASAAAKPHVSIAGGYDYARPNPSIFPRADEWNDSWDVSVNLRWSLWDGGRRRAEEASAAAGTRALLARTSEFDRNLAFEIEQRRLQAQSAHAAIAAAEDGVRAAVEARRVVGERFNAGVATSAEVLDAQTDVLQAELTRTRAIADARLALARLDRALGR